jgi:polysaccharide export outer membrane protein
MKKVTKWAVLLWLGVMATAGMQAQSARPPDNNAAAPAAPAAAPAPAPAANTPPDYVIGSDDQLHITVWKEQELTETLPVRPDGKISMPLLNDVPAAGLTPLELAASITEKLKKYIADPRVTVVVTAMNSRRVFVTGEVLHTGAINLLPHMTVLQALSNAGFTQFANMKGIYILRTVNGQQQRIPFNYKDVVKGRHPEQNIELKAGDTIVVP